MGIADQQLSARASAAGVAIVNFKTSSNRSVYTVQQVSVEYPTAPIGCTCDVRKNGSLITPMIPTGDAASGDPPIVLRGNDVMAATFRNCTPGDIVNVFVIFDDGSQR